MKWVLLSKFYKLRHRDGRLACLILYLKKIAGLEFEARQSGACHLPTVIYSLCLIWCCHNYI